VPKRGGGGGGGGAGGKAFKLEAALSQPDGGGVRMTDFLAVGTELFMPLTISATRCWVFV
jgi:hypothetical protein